MTAPKAISLISDQAADDAFPRDGSREYSSEAVDHVRSVTLDSAARRPEGELATLAKWLPWYQTDHLPLAVKTFGARRGWRSGSVSGSGVHVAFSELDPVEAAQARPEPDRASPLVAHSDRMLGTQVQRRRAVLDIVQEYVP